MKGWGGIKPGWARVSIGFYITTEEFEFLMAAIEFLATYGQRFLPLYDFDWKTGDWTFKEDYQAMVVEAEKSVSSKEKHHWWSLQSSESAAKGLGGKLKPIYMSYMQIAQCIAESLPEQPPLRDIPEGLDPDLLTFRV